MTKLFMLLLVAFATLCCVSCSDDDDDKNKDFPTEDPNDPNIVRTITLTVDTYSTVEFTLDNEKWYDRDYPEISVGKCPFPKDLSVDWGDGSVTSSNTHKYEISGKYNIVISAKDLKWFSSDDNDITAIDVKGCNSLVGIQLYGEDINSLDVAGFTELKYLYLNDNDHLRTLNIDGCDKLNYCYCMDGELETLNIDDCKNLKILELRDNNLTELNIPKENQLEGLGLSYNNIAALDVSHCSLLQRLYLVDNELTSLDISQCPALFFLNCKGNEFDTDALNKIFTDLPQGKEITEEYNPNDIRHSTIYIGGNPGTETCDKSIAENKGWIVIDEYR